MSNSALGKHFGLGVPAKLVTSDEFPSDRGTGIELELELVSTEQRNRMSELNDWNTTTDGSLRDGIELVSHVLHGVQVGTALDEAYETIDQRNVTWRCGLHVHIDVRDKSAAELHSICSLYCVLEGLMFAVEGNNRDNSRFCIPWGRQTAQVAQIAVDCIRGADELARGAQAMGKYSALNLMPIQQQGSIEFRHALMSSDRQFVKQWARLCQSIVDCAGTMTSTDILMRISQHGAIEGLRSIIGSPVPAIYELEDAEDLIWRGVDLANLLETTVSTINESLVEESKMTASDYKKIIKRIRSKKGAV